MIDLDADDFYLFDTFRVIGGKEHMKFQHATPGNADVEGVSLVPAELNTFEGFMKDYRGGKAESLAFHLRRTRRRYAPFYDGVYDYAYWFDDN
jgi:hypothetical protein